MNLKNGVAKFKRNKLHGPSINHDSGKNTTYRTKEVWSDQRLKKPQVEYNIGRSGKGKSPAESQIILLNILEKL